MDSDTDTNFAVALSIKNARGEDAAIDGDIIWTSSDETVLLPVPDPGGKTGTIETVAPSHLDADGKMLPARVTFTGDADMGAGVVPIVGVTEDINLVAGPNSRASMFTVALTAVPKAAPATA